MSLFEFPEYSLTIEAESLEEAKKILNSEIKAGNVIAKKSEEKEVKEEPKENKESKKSK